MLEASGCEPTIDRAALEATAVVADEPASEPPQAEIEADEAAEEAAVSDGRPESVSPDLAPAGTDGGGVDAWIWIVLGLLFAAAVGGALYWVRRPLGPR